MNTRTARIIFPKWVWQGVLIAWICLWAAVMLKNVLVKGHGRDHAELLKRASLEERHAYVAGEGFYELIVFARKHIPPGSTFGYYGVRDRSLSDRQARYYLYPLLWSDAPDYLLVFNPDAGARFDASWVMFAQLDSKRFIMEKRRG